MAPSINAVDLVCLIFLTKMIRHAFVLHYSMTDSSLTYEDMFSLHKIERDKVCSVYEKRDALF